MSEITNLLDSWNQGDPAALDRLIPLVYEELRRIAEARLADERSEHTLRPTALVHEAYMRLLEYRDPKWTNRSHFFGVASGQMRRILVDYARKRNSAKRGSGIVRVNLSDADHPVPFDLDWVDLDTAMEKLSAMDPGLGRLVELRYFGGLTISETAEVMGISEAELKRQWPAAKAFLFREVSGTWNPIVGSE